jgi:hypothetical protein
MNLMKDCVRLHIHGPRGFVGSFQKPFRGENTLTTRTHTDPFTLQYVAGQDNINQVRCVLPRQTAVHKL